VTDITTDHDVRQQVEDDKLAEDEACLNAWRLRDKSDCAEESSSRVAEMAAFIDHFCAGGCVSVEYARSHFELDVAQVERRLTFLVSEGDLIGVREGDWFLSFSRANVEALAALIAERGRVSFVELAADRNAWAPAPQSQATSQH
jgi:hypothetical protein